MIKTKIKVEAPGKLILLGEYAVLEQAPALVAAVDRYCRVEITPSFNSFFHFTAPNLGLNNIGFKIDKNGSPVLSEPVNDAEFKKLRFVFAILEHLATDVDSDLESADIRIDTEDFYHQKSKQKLGLGSSAALTVAFLQALTEFMGKDTRADELFRDALGVHRIAQGELGSGVDIAASASGGIIQYRMPKLKEPFDGEITNLEWPDDLKVVAIWTGSSASTQSFVKTVNRFRAAAPRAYTRVMDKMINLCEEGCKAFRSGDINGFLEIIPAFTNLEGILGNSSGTDIVSEAHKKISRLVDSAGGVYKPSGAGGGDIGLAFCSDDDTLQQIKSNISETSFEVLDLSILKEGIQVS